MRCFVRLIPYSLLFSLFFVNFAGAKETKKCGSAKVVSGSTCSSLKVKFKFDGCGEMVKGAPKMKCGIDQGTATLTGKKYEYSVQVHTEAYG